MTVAATASPTFVGGRDSGTLHCSKQGFVFLGVNGTDLIPNPYRQVECPGILNGQIQAAGGIFADSFHRQVQRCQFLLQESVHCCRAAEEERYLFQIHILGHQLCRNEPLFISGFLLIAEDIDNLQSLLGKGIQLCFIGNVCFISCAIEENHVIGFILIHHTFRHGQERRNTGATGHADNLLAVPEGFIVEFSAGLAHSEAVAYLGLGVQIVGEESSIFHAQGEFVFQGFPGAGRNGVRTADQTFSNCSAQRGILTRTEERKCVRIHPSEGKLLHPICQIPDSNQLHFHGTWVKFLRQYIGPVFLGNWRIGTVCQGFPPLGHNFLEPEHIHKSKDLSFEFHITSPPLSGRQPSVVRKYRRRHRRWNIRWNAWRSLPQTAGLERALRPLSSSSDGASGCPSLR